MVERLWQSICNTRGATKGKDCTCMYRNILLDLQWPMMRIMSMSTQAQSRFMASEAHNDWTDISSGEMPYPCPIAVVDWHKCHVKVVVSILHQHVWWYWYKGVCGGTRCWRKWLISLMKAIAGHKTGCPEQLRSTNSPHMPFFWFVNSSATYVMRIWASKVMQSSVDGCKCGSGWPNVENTCPWHEGYLPPF